MAALRNRHLSLVAAFYQDPPAQNLTASSPLATDDFNVPVALFRERCGGEFDRPHSIPAPFPYCTGARCCSNQPASVVSFDAAWLGRRRMPWGSSGTRTRTDSTPRIFSAL
jgi:hypothetical protein